MNKWTDLETDLLRRHIKLYHYAELYKLKFIFRTLDC